MERIGVSKLWENLTRVLKRVEAGEVITITSRGNEVARLVPPEHTPERARKTLHQLRQTAIVGDVLSSIEDAWTAMSRTRHPVP